MMASKQDHTQVPWPAVEPAIFLPLKWISLLATLLPAATIYFCITYSFTIGSEAISEVTLSGCPNVKSRLPPISWAIGIWEPQRLIWLLVLLIHVPPRIIMIALYPQVWAPGACQLCLWVCSAIEGTSLVLITIFDIDSIAGFYVHAAFYVSWTYSSSASMISSVHLSRKTELKDRSATFHRTFIAKCSLMAMFVSGVAIAGVVYPIAQRFCIGWAYAAFSVFEYFLVGINATFWAVCLYELSTVYVGFRVTSVQHDEIREKTPGSAFIINTEA